MKIDNLYIIGEDQNKLSVEIAKKYPGRKVEIDVSEDGENGSHAVYERV